jgi:hypothetical protein
MATQNTTTKRSSIFGNVLSTPTAELKSDDMTKSNVFNPYTHAGKSTGEGLVREVNFGPKLRLSGLAVSSVPAADDSGRLSDFLRDVITEAHELIKTVQLDQTVRRACPSRMVESPWTLKSKEQMQITLGETSTYEAPIRQLTRRRDLAGTGEFWAARRSEYAGAHWVGRAQFPEFYHAFKLEHPQSEVAFTPAVKGFHVVQEWDVKDVEAYRGNPRESAYDQVIWQNFTMQIVEMRHEMPTRMMGDRVFPILQITADRRLHDDFLVVSIPISDIQTHPNAKLSKESGVVLGSYVSVERVRMVSRRDLYGPAIDQPDVHMLEWTMATCGSAGGIIPQFLQNRVLADKIKEDVELFLKWAEEQRNAGVVRTLPDEYMKREERDMADEERRKREEAERKERQRIEEEKKVEAWRQAEAKRVKERPTSGTKHYGTNAGMYTSSGSGFCGGGGGCF